MENPSLSDEAVAAWAKMIRVSQSLLSRVEADLKAAGLPPLAWYDALLELRRAGRAGLRPYALQQEMLLAQYNLSRLADRLIASGYVERQPCAEDGRGHVLVITPAGRAVAKRMWPVYRAAIRRHFADRLGGRDIKTLAAIMDKLA